jgi:hypothetical protein
MDRANPYEAACAAYFQCHRLGYVAVDETRRAQLGDGSLKSLDFIVHGEAGSRLLVDVKGRRFPGGKPGQRRHVWECWSTAEDIRSLSRWLDLFGPGYRGILLFAHQVLPEVTLPDNVEDLWMWRGRRYLLRAVALEDYRQHMRVRSPKWGTVTLATEAFRRLAQPLHRFTHQANVADCPF